MADASLWNGDPFSLLVRNGSLSRRPTAAADDHDNVPGKTLHDRISARRAHDPDLQLPMDEQSNGPDSSTRNAQVTVGEREESQNPALTY